MVDVMVKMIINGDVSSWPISDTEKITSSQLVNVDNLMARD